MMMMSPHDDLDSPDGDERRGKDPARPRSVRRRVLHSLLAAVLLLGAVEIGLRAFVYYGKEPYRPSLAPIGAQYGDLIPNERKMFLAKANLPYWWITNSQGLRDTRDFAVPKPEGLIRILCVGDSITFGPFLEQHDTYPAWLERHLRRILGQDVEVINAGVQGYTICDEYAYLSERGRGLSPDLVVLQLCLNDVPGMSDEMRTHFCRGGPCCIRPHPRALTPHMTQRWLGRHLALVRAARDVREALSLRRAMAVVADRDWADASSREYDYLFTDRYADQRAEHERQYEAVFDSFMELIQEMGVPCVVLLRPTLHRVRDDSLSAHVEEFFEGLCRRHSVPFVHPLAASRRVGDVEALYLLPHDGHPTRYGCQVLARSVAGPIVRVLRAPGQEGPAHRKHAWAEDPEG